MSSVVDQLVSVPYRMGPGLRRLELLEPVITPTPLGNIDVAKQKRRVTRRRPRMDWFESVDRNVSRDALWTLVGLLHRHRDLVELDGTQLICDLTGRYCWLDHDDDRSSWMFMHEHLEEDFAVINGRTTELELISFCFPSGWTPREKIGLPLLAVHAPVPNAAQLNAATSTMVKIVASGDRYRRNVWTLKPSAKLDGRPTSSSASFAETGEVYFRWETQTFVPMPDDRALFLVRTQVKSVEQAEAPLLLAAIASMRPETLAYKGLDDPALREALLSL